MKLDRGSRMQRWAEFDGVRRLGHSRGGLYLVIGVLRDESLGLGRKFGFITSKKAHRHAVKRNRMRRQFREIIRKHGDQLPGGIRLVVIARWKAADADFASIEKDWLKVVKRMGLLTGVGSEGQAEREFRKGKGR